MHAYCNRAKITPLGVRIGLATWAGLSIRFEVGGEIVKVDGTGGRRPPHRRVVWGAAQAPSGVQGQSPVGGPGANPPEAKWVWLIDIAFPQSNYNKSHFLKRTLFLLCGKRRQSSRNPGRFVTSLSLLSIQHGGQQNRSRCFSVRVLSKL